MVITFRYCITESAAAIVIEVEAGSRSILIFSSAIPGSSVTIRRNLPSSLSVVAGSIVFIGLVLFEFAICIGLISLSFFFEPGDFPGNFFYFPSYRKTNDQGNDKRSTACIQPGLRDYCSTGRVRKPEPAGPIPLAWTSGDSFLCECQMNNLISIS